MCVTAMYSHIFFQHIDLNPMMISYGCFLYRESKTERKGERAREREMESEHNSAQSALKKMKKGKKKQFRWLIDTAPNSSQWEMVESIWQPKTTVGR